jgi:hypothetical protein
MNNQGDDTLIGCAVFRYEPCTDSYVCPGNKKLLRRHTNHKDHYMYKASAGACGACSLKSRCTQAPRCDLARHLYEEALNRIQELVTAEAMKVRRSTVDQDLEFLRWITVTVIVLVDKQVISKGQACAGPRGASRRTARI